MGKAHTFEATWKVEDGYIGHGPQYLNIDEDCLDEDMSDEDIKKLFWDSIEDDFSQQVSYVSEDEEDFVEWARERLEERRE